MNNFDVDLRFFIFYSKLLFPLPPRVLSVCSAEEVFPHVENVNLESN